MCATKSLRGLRCGEVLAHYSSVSKRIAPGLRPDRKAVWFGSDRDRFHGRGRRIDRVDNLVEASGEPQKFTVRTDISHVGAAAPGNWPCLFHSAGDEINH